MHQGVGEHHQHEASCAAISGPAEAEEGDQFPVRTDCGMMESGSKRLAGKNPAGAENGSILGGQHELQRKKAMLAWLILAGWTR